MQTLAIRPKRASTKMKRRGRSRKQKSSVLSLRLNALGIPLPLRLRYQATATIAPYSHGGPYPYATDSFYANSVYHIDGAANIANLTGLNYFYSKYIVRGASISVTGINKLATSGLNMVVWPTVTFTTPATFAIAADQRLAKVAVLAPAGSGATVKTLTHTIDVAQFVGLPGLSPADSSWVGAGLYQIPPSTCSFGVFWETTDGATTLSADVTVRLVYDVEFFGLVPAVL